MASDISARKLVEQIWEQVAAEQALRPPPEAGLPDYDRLIEDNERRYVNSRYVLGRIPAAMTESPHRRGVQRIKGGLRARAARFVVGALRPYFDDEQEFLAHLVRLQNTITVHIDRLSAEVRALEALLQAESNRLRAADATLHARLEDRLQGVEDVLEALLGQSRGPGR